MSENKSRMTLREAFAATRRGYSILWKAMPKIFPVSLAKNALTALSPYVPLYFTARLVNTVAGGGGGAGHGDIDGLGPEFFLQQGGF